MPSLTGDRVADWRPPRRPFTGSATRSLGRCAPRYRSRACAATVARVTDGLVPILVGLAEHGSPGSSVSPGGFNEPAHASLQRRSELVKQGIDWAGLGVVPRWVVMESSDCAAALEPGIYHNDGASERDRYIAGAGSRGETALLISTIGDASSTRRNPLSVYDASVSLSLESGSVDGRRLPTGTTVSLAHDLNRADRDLALRLKNRPPGVWWTLELGGSRWTSGSGVPLGTTGPDGNLAPIIVDGLGDPVVAVWTSPQLDLRWYIVPDRIDWPTVIDWLVQQALPAYVPGVLRRSRSGKHTGENLRTGKEAQARQAGYGAFQWTHFGGLKWPRPESDTSDVGLKWPHRG